MEPTGPSPKKDDESDLLPPDARSRRALALRAFGRRVLVGLAVVTIFGTLQVTSGQGIPESQAENQRHPILIGPTVWWVQVLVLDVMILVVIALATAFEYLLSRNLDQPGPTGGTGGSLVADDLDEAYRRPG